MLVVSLRGRFWFSLKGFRTESQYLFSPKRSAHQKRNAVIRAVLEHGLLFSGKKPAPRPYWSPLGDLHAPMQASYFISLPIVFRDRGIVMSPSLLFSQPITNLVRNRCRSAPFRTIIFWQTSSWLTYRSCPWSLVSYLHSNGFCWHGKRH